MGLLDGVGFDRRVRMIGNVVCAQCSLEKIRPVLVLDIRQIYIQ